MDVVPAPEHHRPRRAVTGRACAGTRQRELPALGGVGTVGAEEQRLQAALVETLALASPRRREVLALAALGGMPPSAIATVLGLSLEAVSIQLHEGVNEVVTRFTN